MRWLLISECCQRITSRYYTHTMIAVSCPQWSSTLPATIRFYTQKMIAVGCQRRSNALPAKKSRKESLTSLTNYPSMWMAACCWTPCTGPWDPVSSGLRLCARTTTVSRFFTKRAKIYHCVVGNEPKTQSFLKIFYTREMFTYYKILCYIFWVGRDIF